MSHVSHLLNLLLIVYRNTLKLKKKLFTLFGMATFFEQTSIVIKFETHQQGIF